ncbi:MAG: hypothetical protein ABIC96_04245 [Patescibacteria group bacterium]
MPVALKEVGPGKGTIKSDFYLGGMPVTRLIERQYGEGEGERTFLIQPSLEPSEVASPLLVQRAQEMKAMQDKHMNPGREAFLDGLRTAVGDWSLDLLIIDSNGKSVGNPSSTYRTGGLVLPSGVFKKPGEEGKVYPLIPQKDTVAFCFDREGGIENLFREKTAGEVAVDGLGDIKIIHFNRDLIPPSKMRKEGLVLGKVGFVSDGRVKKGAVYFDQRSAKGLVPGKLRVSERENYQHQVVFSRGFPVEEKYLATKSAMPRDIDLVTVALGTFSRNFPDMPCVVLYKTPRPWEISLEALQKTA